ncbi:MBOAT family protein [Chroococcus sp. FPU101]|uniref:MBOAT family O-acyltransferase n=1 Tax=Chroococcus sp. FPU101 TaxID=1974212 RepID=UPI001A8F5380|nr:MBOAT family protein [Chroococcus sp. FPU101]GFE70877.1 putative membrane protein involved in D-alanine export [Chroococcus sp. FPU101]
MLFNSVEFLIFLLIVYILYRFLPFRGQNVMLLVASYIFYGWWDKRFLFLIILTTALDFCCSLVIERGRLTLKERLIPCLTVFLAAFFFLLIQWQAVTFQFLPFNFSIKWGQLFPQNQLLWQLFGSIVLILGIVNLIYPYLVRLIDSKRRHVVLLISICANLGILFFFKYFNFFIGSAKTALSALGIEADFFQLNIILPVGISFYTFQTMSYTIDVYRKSLQATDHFFDFALYLSFFPQLVAGPIERASELLPRILKPRTLDFDESMRGLFLILFGLFKKIAIADSIAISVNSVYGNTGYVSWLDVVLATLLFTFQIYCDFSAYSDIARGVAKLLGFELMRNFNLPYFSQTPSEFWRRWHISLSTWLRDYLYIPLGGNKKSKNRTYINLMLTMVLGGLWHGAAWNFVLWGFYHGFLLCIYRVLDITYSEKVFNIKFLLKTGIFFILTFYGWLLFRASSFEQISQFTQILLTHFGEFTYTIQKPSLAGLIGLPLLIFYEILEYLHKNPRFYLSYPSFIRGAFYALLTLVIFMGMSNAPEQFIYFQF